MSKHKGICPTCESFTDLETVTVIMRRKDRDYQSSQTRCEKTTTNYAPTTKKPTNTPKNQFC